MKCLGCNTHQTVALDIVRRPKSTPIHELERYMRCKDCTQVRGYPYKRSHLVALRVIRHEKKIAFQEIKTHPQRSRGPATASAEIIEAQPQRGVAADHDAALSAPARVS